jgi:hypothetical protein
MLIASATGWDAPFSVPRSGSHESVLGGIECH